MRRFQPWAVLLLAAPAVAVEVLATVQADGVAAPQLLRTEKGRIISGEDLCVNGPQNSSLCVEHKCGDQTFETAQCAATAEGVAACPGTQVCQDKSTQGKAAYKCCCPPCE
ncbi:unnamed protein product [Effrenium voratum]|nr:unnamed protein product [Effrenium voratum]|mmetsp:Transcript_12087/g.28646  ORF Transcript_12087/g.28646 Transcript_12087/m.28646 type:complete len:111 (-) Transcript_12087:60-392(-)